MFNYKCNITPQDTNGKVIFCDIDGTLAPYRFDGGVSDVPFFCKSKLFNRLLLAQGQHL